MKPFCYLLVTILLSAENNASYRALPPAIILNFNSTHKRPTERCCLAWYFILLGLHIKPSSAVVSANI